MIFSGDFDKSLENLREEYNRVKTQNEFLREQVKSWNKDKEIQKAKLETEEERKLSLYRMTESEMEARKKFIDEHHKRCGNSGSFLYGIEHCGIGASLSIKCPVCGEEKDITDYSVW